MSAATSTPQAMRDRLLLAIDAQSNICNMAVVLEVISVLEKYPITRDALEETRLGKIINDVRRKTKDEVLAKRAKKLLRNWQKFIEPGKGEFLTRGLIGASWSSNGVIRPCICPPAAIASLGKTGPELKTRCDFNNCAPSVEELSIRERKEDQKDGQPQQAKILPTTFDHQTQNSTQLRHCGLGGRANNVHTHYSLDGETSQPTDKNKGIKIPIHAAKLYPSAPKSDHPNLSSLDKASVLQQGQAATGGQCSPRHLQSSHTGSQKQETFVKPAGAQIQNIYHPSLRTGIVETQTHSATSCCCEDVGLVKDGPTGIMKKPKQQKYRSKDYMEPLERPLAEGQAKTEMVKERRVTFEPVTGKIKPSYNKESFWDGNISGHHRHKVQNQSVTPSLFQQSSKSQTIYSYLSQQSNVLTLSGVQAHGAPFFMTSEILKKEERWFEDGKKTHNVSDHPPKELPGVSREIRSEDLQKLHMQKWSGVNGCYDSKGNWYDWTKCMHLERDGSESRLKILPYVCLDYI
nr:mediator of RNA polymerase II transcription subunit 26 [Nothobranchius furzeri]